MTQLEWRVRCSDCFDEPLSPEDVRALLELLKEKDCQIASLERLIEERNDDVARLEAARKEDEN